MGLSKTGVKTPLVSPNCKKCTWTLVVLLIFSLSLVMISNTLRENLQNPVLTSLQLAPVSQAPFPAISVDTGEVLDPSHFWHKVLAQVEFECFFENRNLSYSFNYVCQPENREANKQNLRHFLKPNIDQLVRKTLEKVIEIIPKDAAMRRASVSALRWKWLKENQDLVEILAFGLMSNLTTSREQIQIMVELCSKYFGYLDIFELVYELEFSVNRALTQGFEELWSTTGSKVSQHFIEEATLILITPHAAFMSASDRYISLDEFIGFFYNASYHGPYYAKMVDSIFNGSIPLQDMWQVVSLISEPDENSGCQGQKFFEHFGCLDETSLLTYRRGWRTFLNQLREALPNGTSGLTVPCQDPNIYPSIAKCCESLKVLQGNLAGLLRVMKYAVQTPTMLQSREENQADFSDTSFLQFPSIRIPNQAEHEQLMRIVGLGGGGVTFTPFISRYRNPNPRVLSCKGQQNNMFHAPFECSGFYRRLSNQGLAFTYNAGSYWDRYQENDVSKLYLQSLMSDNQDQREQKIRYPSMKGRDNHLKMALRLDPSLETIKQHRLTLPNIFKIHIHDPLDVPDFQNSFVEIKPLHEYTIQVRPSITELSEQFAGMSPQNRGCRLLSEADDLCFFKQYTQTACFYECQIRQASGICHCVPWDVPNILGTSIVCDFNGQECFHRVLHEMDTAHCDCPISCNLGRYEYSVTALKLDPVMECQNGVDLDLADSLTNPIYMGTKPFLRQARELLLNQSESNLAMCLRQLKRIAFVNVHLGSQTVTLAQKDLRVTFGLMLSNLGGTMSLFTGLSILSLIEGLYLVYTKGARICSKYFGPFSRAQT